MVVRITVTPPGTPDAELPASGENDWYVPEPQFLPHTSDGPAVPPAQQRDFDTLVTLPEVPTGSEYSASRNAWRAPGGKIIDAGEFRPLPPDRNTFDPQMLPDQRGMESALIRVSATRRKQAALDFLNDVAPPEPTAEVAPATTAAVAPPVVEEEPQIHELKKATPLSAVLKDIGRGLTEAPRQMVGGARDALQSTIDFADWLAAPIEFTGADGKTEKVPLNELTDKLPEVKKADSVTGGVVRSVSQFLTGFVAAGPATGAIKSALGVVPQVMARGALADFAAFPAHEERLSNLIESVPALQNPVTAFMAAKPGENEAEGRLKRAVEGLGLGALAEGVFRGVRYLRDVRRAEAGAEVPAVKPAVPKDPLGDPAAPAIVKADAKASEKIGGEAGTYLGVSDETVAKSLTERGLTPLAEGEHPIYVNFARIRTPEDVHQVIADTTAAFAGDIEAARRGVRTHAQTKRAADNVDAWEVLQQRRQGAPLNAEEGLAARRLWEASAEKVMAMAEQATAAPTPENLFAFRRMLAIHGEIQSQAIAARTETARALNAWAIPVGASGRARLESIDNILTTHGGTEAAEALAQRVAALKGIGNGAWAEPLAAIAEKSWTVKSADVAKELWINAVLSGPKTHLVNIMGNTASLGLELIERSAASRWSQAIGSGAMQPGEAAAQVFSLGAGIREGFRMFRLALKEGESQFGAKTSKTADLGFSRALSSEALGVEGSWFGKAVDALGLMAGLSRGTGTRVAEKMVDIPGTVFNLPTRFLTAEDDFFKSITYRREVNAQAFRQAVKDVQDAGIPEAAMAPSSTLNARIADYIRNPPEDMKLAAVDAALYSTFTNKAGKLAEAVNHFDRRLSASPYAGAQIGSLFLRYVIPFRNTLANISAYSIERTPMAPLLTRWREQWAKGGAARDVVETRMALGTFALMGLMDLAFDGNISGSGPSRRQSEEKGTRQTMERTGWQPYSIKIGDTWFSYKRSDPLGLSIGYAADIAQHIVNAEKLDEDQQDNVKRLVFTGIASFGNQMLDKHYTQGLAELFDVLQNQSQAERYVDRRTASYVPNVFAQVRQVTDPYLRYSSGLMDEIRNKMPGLSDNLPLSRDMWGRPRTYQSGMGTVYDAISPIAARKVNPQPIDTDALKHDFNLTMPGWSLSYGAGVNISLRDTPAIYSRFLELRGQMKPTDLGEVRTGADRPKRKGDWTASEVLVDKYGDQPMLETLNAIVGGSHPLSDAYAEAGSGRNGGKDRMVSRIVADYARAAKSKLLTEFPDLSRKVGRKERQLEERE